jgi:hypothetical protein
MNKPFHMLTPAERTALRIAQNRAIDEKIKETQTHVAKPPAHSSNDFTRATPEERAQIRGSLVRKVSS